MKVGIITVFFTENCGSVLQATALADKFKQYGNDVYFIDTRNKLSGHSIKRLLKNCIKAIIKKESLFNAIKKYIDYDKYIKEHFKIIHPQQKVDRVVIGSDTVWDVDSSYFLLSQEVFWGENTNCKNISTYAVSIANSDYEKLDNLQYPGKCIEKYSMVSVRDKYTKHYVDRFRDKPAQLVCDPTLLHDKAYYEEKCRKIIDDKYVLLYLFDEPIGAVAKEIRKFANEKSCKIISMVCMGKRLACADLNVESTIDNFFDYFNSASYVVTNTFHGTVFSVIFNKNFVVLDYNKKKVSEFLTDVGLTGRLTTNHFEQLFSLPINYSETNEYLAKIRNNSEEYIMSIIKG